MIRILLVDDHPSARDGTKFRLEEEPDMSVTAVQSGMDAIALIQAGERFSIMLFDLHMPIISGLELTRRIIEIHPHANILIYTGYDILPNFNILIEAGVSGFISKASSWEYLVQSIRFALQGESILPTALLKQLRRSDVVLPIADHSGLPELTSITQREQTILQEISLGKSNKEIAELLFMSQRNVEYHLSRIFEKLHVRSRFEAIAEAKKYGLIKNSELL
ncbi:response regulator transcription factor [Paenibacillus sp. SN-8-1]|uniref:response regulator transcription factor n=1 Tax=Paenibacillus sp. SN-8-1 TaxID=3435409 RepID=UPI003D9A8A44